jgi:hypothetical protein
MTPEKLDVLLKRCISLTSSTPAGRDYWCVLDRSREPQNVSRSFRGRRRHQGSEIPPEHHLQLVDSASRLNRCVVFPVAFGVETIYLNRRGSMKLVLCAAIGTAHWIEGRSYRPGPSKQQPCSARAIHHSLFRSWHQVGLISIISTMTRLCSLKPAAPKIVRRA